MNGRKIPSASFFEIQSLEREESTNPLFRSTQTSTHVSHPVQSFGSDTRRWRRPIMSTYRRFTATLTIRFPHFCRFPRKHSSVGAHASNKSLRGHMRLKSENPFPARRSIFCGAVSTERFGRERRRVSGDGRSDTRHRRRRKPSRRASDAEERSC